MFSKHPTTYDDLSSELREEHDWQVGDLRSFEYLLDVTSFAIEPLSGLLAIGTASGVIHIFGGPGVELKQTLPHSIGIKFLHFAPSVYKLVCIDDNNQLCFWDLAAIERKHTVLAGFRQTVNCLTISPSHAHAFIALQSGEIETYDLLCLQKSPYTIPNMWALYEDKIAGTEMLTVSSLADCTPIDLVIHPRDLNLVFVAYRGGIILSNLTQRNTIHAYELSSPPGIPEGAGYTSKHRRLSVTALAIHPAGHLFAVGYADGSIAFWSVEDSDKPLLVRTIDDGDINIVEMHKLGEGLESTEDAHATSSSGSFREPIIKLSWSGFPNPSDLWGGETALTVLGGLAVDHAIGLTVQWFPVIDLVQSPVSPVVDADLSKQEGIRKSLIPSQTFFLSTPGIIQDFLLIPRSSPHFSGSFDPIAILLLCDCDGDTRSTDAYQFPSPASVKSSAPSLLATASADAQSVGKVDNPLQLRLPNPLRNGNDGVLDAQLVNLDHDAYKQLVLENTLESDSLPLSGGVAWTNDWSLNEKTFVKYQCPRILVTTHRNLTVQFQDISAQLLINADQLPIQNDFPRLLPDLTIDLMCILLDPILSHRICSTAPPQTPIDSVHLAKESLECAVVLQTGEVVIFRMRSGPCENVPYRENNDEELISLEHVPLYHDRRFYPYLMLVPKKGPVTAFAISDIGFFAAAYGDGSLLVADLRGPRVMLRYCWDPDAKSKEKLPLLLKHPSTKLIDPIGSLTWTVNSLGSGSRPRILLIAVHTSGLLEIFTINRPAGSHLWTIDSEPLKSKIVPSPLSGGVFVVDSRTGTKRKADRSRLGLSLQSSPTLPDTHGILIAVGAKVAKCILDIVGEQVGKVDWSNKAGTAVAAEVVEKMGSHALVVFTDRHEAWVYSLPHLTRLHIFQISGVSKEPPAIDESGDFVGCFRHAASGTVKQLTYSSLFTTRRNYASPDIDLRSTKPSVPPQPGPVSVSPTAMLSSWFGFGPSMTGGQLDALLAGPDRPLHQVQQEETETASINAPVAAVAGLYGRLSSALSERGQMLEGLEERFNSLEEGSKSMLAQAKRLAAEQQARRWFG